METPMGGNSTRPPTTQQPQRTTQKPRRNERKIRCAHIIPQPHNENKIAEIIKDTDPPETIHQLSRIPYPTFKELTKLELTYMTYYEETQVIQKKHNRHCPTCQKHL